LNEELLLVTGEPVDLAETDLVEVVRFVRLVEDLTAEALAAVDIDSLPTRDRTYVRRLKILAQEDASLIQRQRLVWLKLRHGIGLLEGEAKELLQVLGCRGFYFSGLNLDGMVLGTLDLSGGMIVGDFCCQYTRVLGLCDERGLIVGGRYLTHNRRVEGELATDGLRVLEHTTEQQARSPLSWGCIDEHLHPSETRRDGAQSLDAASNVDEIEELTDDDIITSYAPPSTSAGAQHSYRPLFPSSLPPCSTSPAARRYSFVPRMGSYRRSGPPRTSVAPRLPPAALRSFSASATRQISQLDRGVAPETDEIDVAWE
jgi:hypothetical protein